MNEKIYGLIEENPDVRDWRMGSITGARKEVLREDGDWRDFVPSEEEIQAGVYFDTYACVTFSALNNLEMIAKAKGIEMNRSDRFTAKMSGTTTSGNSLRNVATSVSRWHGTVAEEDWPFPRTQRTPVFDWDDYYKEIPQELQDLGLSWLEDWDVSFEWIPTDKESIREALKYGPLQVGVYAYPKPLENGMYDDGGRDRRNHAVTLIYAGDDCYEILDHYERSGKITKRLVPDYDFKWIMQFTLNPKKDKPMPIIDLPNDCLVQLVEGKGGFGLHVDGKLYVDDTDKILASWLVRSPEFGRKKAITQAQWDSFPKFNLKNEPLD